MVAGDADRPAGDEPGSGDAGSPGDGNGPGDAPADGDSGACPAGEQPLDFPGFIDDPEGLEMFHASAYNSARDEYLLAVRYDQPSNIYGRYLDSQARTLSDDFLIRAHPAGGPSAHYSPTSRRYLVRWDWGYKQTFFRMVDGDSTNPSPALTPETVISGNGTAGSGLVAQVAYGSAQDHFLAVWAAEAGGNQGHIHGRFISGDGTALGMPFLIAGTNKDETSPQVTYASSSDRFLVTWQRFVNSEQSFDVYGALLDSEGNLTHSVPVATNAAQWWDVPGPVGYDPVSDTFGVATFAAVSTYFRTVDPHDATLGEVRSVSNGNAAPTSMSVRPVAGASQFLVTWRQGYNGVYAGLVPAP